MVVKSFHINNSLEAINSMTSLVPTEKTLVMDFEENFKESLRCMWICRCHPAIGRDLKWIAQMLLIYSPYTFIFVISAYNVLVVNAQANDFSAMCRSGVLVMSYIQITFSYIIMVWKQQKIMNLIDSVQKDYLLARFLSLDEKDIVLEFARQGKFVCKQWFVITLGGFCIFPIKCFVLTIYYWKTDSFRFLPLYELVYPKFIEDSMENITVYIIIVYVIVSSFAMVSGSMYLATVPIGPIFMLHACGQLEILKKRIEGLLDCDVEEVLQRLKEIILRLQYTYDFVDETNSSFSVLYEIALKSTTIMLPICIYETLESLKVGKLSLEYVAFIVGSILMCSSPCYYSDLLMEKGHDIRTAIYSIGWENSFNRPQRNTILIILHRALRPVAVHTLFRTLNLDTLTDVFRQSFSIFNLMNAMWE